MCIRDRFTASESGVDLACVPDLFVPMGTKTTVGGTNDLDGFLGGTLLVFGVLGAVRHHEVLVDRRLDSFAATLSR